MIVAILMFGCLHVSQAQKLDEFLWMGEDYAGETFMGFSYNQALVTNSTAPNSDNHTQKGWSIKIDIRGTNYEKGEARVNYNNKLLGDLISYSSGIISGEASVYQTESSSLTTGLLGWLSVMWNLNKPNRFQMALGFNINDYMLTSAYVADTSRAFSNNNSIVQEPNGYYFTAGPSLAANLMVTKYFMVEYHGTLSIPYYRYKQNELVTDGNYKTPYFINHSVEVVTPIGLFVGYELNGIENRGDLPNNTKRADWLLGFRLML